MSKEAKWRAGPPPPPLQDEIDRLAHQRQWAADEVKRKIEGFTRGVEWTVTAEREGIKCDAYISGVRGSFVISWASVVGDDRFLHKAEDLILRMARRLYLRSSQ